MINIICSMGYYDKKEFVLCSDNHIYRKEENSYKWICSLASWELFIRTLPNSRKNLKLKPDNGE